MPPSTARTSGQPKKLDEKAIRDAMQVETKKRLLKNLHEPHDFQLDAATSLVLGKDTVLIAPTGCGKTLVMAMPLLYFPGKLSLIISPLQALQTGQAKAMNDLGVPSLVIDTVALPPEKFKVCLASRTCVGLLNHP